MVTSLNSVSHCPLPPPQMATLFLIRTLDRWVGISSGFKSDFGELSEIIIDFSSWIMPYIFINQKSNDLRTLLRLRASNGDHIRGQWLTQRKSDFPPRIVAGGSRASLTFEGVTLHSMPDLRSPAGIRAVSPAVEAKSPNHWTAREVSHWLFFNADKFPEEIYGCKSELNRRWMCFYLLCILIYIYVILLISFWFWIDDK